MRAPAIDTSAVVAWLTDGARDCPQPEEVLAGASERLLAAGVPLARAAVFVRTLHPLVAGRRLEWRPGQPVAAGALSYEMIPTPGYADSPVVHVYETARELRRRLGRADCAMDFAVLQSLRDEGITDYLVVPLLFVFPNGGTALVCATTAPGGFADAHIDAIRSIVAPLARVAEIRTLMRTAATLLDTYVGHKTGDRVRAGSIRRGDTEAIRAAIWLSDMRGFTALAEREPPEAVMAVLNRYFDCQVPAIAAHGGEVLKYIGDGVLAIFPVSDGAGAGAACAGALAAARDARAEIDQVAGLRFGLALHLGEVLYGNVGSGDRLDFTCIGPAVNLAARLEKLAAQEGRAVIASAAFARQCGAGLTPLGSFALAGFHEPQTAFGLPEERPAAPAAR